MVNQLPNPGGCSLGIDRPHAPLKQFHPSATFQISSNFSNAVKKALSVRCTELLHHPMFIHSSKVDLRSNLVSHRNITGLQWLVQGKNTERKQMCSQESAYFYFYCSKNGMTSHISFGTLLSALHHSKMCASAPAPKAAFQTVGTCW